MGGRGAKSASSRGAGMTWAQMHINLAEEADNMLDEWLNATSPTEEVNIRQKILGNGTYATAEFGRRMQNDGTYSNMSNKEYNALVKVKQIADAVRDHNGWDKKRKDFRRSNYVL